METVTLDEAKERLATLIERAAAGEEIVIADPGRPSVRLVAAPATTSGAPRPRVFGQLRGQVRIADDFDAPLPEEMQAAFEGRGR